MQIELYAVHSEKLLGEKEKQKRNKMTHGKDHVSKEGMIVALTKHWFTNGFYNYSKNKNCMCLT